MKVSLQQQHPESFLAITWLVALDSDIAGALIGTAEAREERADSAGSKGCDLIAMATQGRGGLERWAMGSITEHVLDTARLPILIVRPGSH